jgi:hypothetical protein
MTSNVTMSCQQIADRIYVVRFATQYALAATFLRIQEHYESSRFRGRVFSLEDYMDWYAAQFGAFTYYEDWTGFNVPSTALDDFYSGRFDPLLRKERQLLRRFVNLRAPFYVIGLFDDSDLTHELAHALFFLQPRYRRDVREALRQHDTAGISKRLAALGYHRRVLEDEVHAYVLAGFNVVGESARALRPLRRTLRSIYAAHAQSLGIPLPRGYSNGSAKREAR